MTTYALIPCSKTKAVFTCLAREMYWPSALFRGAYRVAEARGEVPLILSARYGLLHPEALIEPYDETLATMNRHVRYDWSLTVCIRQGLMSMLQPGDVVVSYLGALYGNDVLPRLREAGYTVEEPLKGMGQGQRLAWFKQQLEQRNAA